MQNWFRLSSVLVHHSLHTRPLTRAMCSIVYVLRREDEENLQLRFRFRPNGCSDMAPRDFTLNRRRTEPLAICLERLRNNVNNHFTKKFSRKKKRKVATTTDESVTCTDDVTPLSMVTLTNENAASVDPATMCTEEGFKEGHSLWLDDTQFTLIVNAPQVKQVRLPSVMLIGYPVYVELSVDFCSPDTCLVEWYSCEAVSRPAVDAGKWKKESTGRCFTPDPLHASQWLRVTVTPRDASGRMGVPETVVASVQPTPGAQQTALTRRMTLTLERAGRDQLRVVSYNLLAEIYADSDTARNELFTHCPSQYLSMEYRQHLLLRELIGYSADVLCLQEVDRSIFEHVLRPALQVEGFDGLWQRKKGHVPEGAAIFYRTDRLHLVEEDSLESVTEALYTMPGLEALREAVVKVEPLLERWKARSQSVAACILTDGARKLCVASTHLYFRPEASHVRLIQTAVLLRHLEMIGSRHSNLGYILGADLNSDERFALHQLIVQGRIPAKHLDWLSAGEAELCEAPSLEHSLKLTNAYVPQPEFTNFTVGFHGALDHVFYDPERLRLVRTVPLPSLEEVTEKVALPNEDFPSDHLALVVDLQWK